jgi:formate-dependent nitrite reductase membrane component NrfD
MSAATASGHQKIWGVRMAASLFLGGTAAGVYLVGFVLGAASGHTAIADVSIPAAAIAAALAMAVLAWHTGRKAKLILAFSRPRTSWMARGATALTLLLVLAVADTILWSARDGYSSGVAHLALGSITSLVAIFVLLYTGMLLTSLKPIAFWDSLVLPAVFMLSGMAAGLLLLALALGISQAAGRDVAAPAKLVVAFSLGFVVVEAACAVVYVWRSRGGESASSTKRVLSGALAPHFWLGAVTVGFLAPVVLCAYSLKAPSAAGLIIIGVTGLAGNALLKYVIVSAGRPRAMQLAGVQIPVPVAALMTVCQYVQEVDQKV